MGRIGTYHFSYSFSLYWILQTYVRRVYRGHVRSPTRQELREPNHPRDVCNWLKPWYFHRFAPSAAHMIIIILKKNHSTIIHCCLSCFHPRHRCCPCGRCRICRRRRQHHRQRLCLSCRFPMLHGTWDFSWFSSWVD